MSHQPSQIIQDLLEGIKSQNQLRVWSLIITFFGDCIVPRGGEVSLSSIQTVMSGFGIESNAVRTALSRLTKDNLLERRKYGRQTTYRLAQEGDALFMEASRRIYSDSAKNWNKQFELVLLTDKSNRTDQEKSKSLMENGFGSPMPGVFIRPKSNEQNPLHLFDVTALTVDLADNQPSSLNELVGKAWPFEELNLAYSGILARFAYLSKKPEVIVKFAPYESLILRVLLIHEWRRIVLKDVALPVSMKPKNWKGEEARNLVSELYGKLSYASEAFLNQLHSEPEHPLPKTQIVIEQRFQS